MMPCFAASDTLGGLLLWTSDLSNYLDCPHLTGLSYAAATGAGPKPPKFDDPALEMLSRKGDEHEVASLH